MEHPEKQLEIGGDSTEADTLKFWCPDLITKLEAQSFYDNAVRSIHQYIRDRPSDRPPFMKRFRLHINFPTLDCLDYADQVLSPLVIGKAIVPELALYVWGDQDSTVTFNDCDSFRKVLVSESVRVLVLNRFMLTEEKLEVKLPWLLRLTFHECNFSGDEVIEKFLKGSSSIQVFANSACKGIERILGITIQNRTIHFLSFSSLKELRFKGIKLCWLKDVISELYEIEVLEIENCHLKRSSMELDCEEFISSESLKRLVMRNNIKLARPQNFVITTPSLESFEYLENCFVENVTQCHLDVKHLSNVRDLHMTFVAKIVKHTQLQYDSVISGCEGMKNYKDIDILLFLRLRGKEQQIFLQKKLCTCDFVPLYQFFYHEDEDNLVGGGMCISTRTSEMPIIPDEV